MRSVTHTVLGALLAVAALVLLVSPAARERTLVAVSALQADGARLGLPLHTTSQAASPGAPVYEATNPRTHAPVRWSSCQPVRVLVDPGPEGASAVAVVRAEAAVLSKASGLHVQVVGTTTTPGDGSWNTRVDRAGHHLPVVVAFVPRTQTDMFRNADGSDSGDVGMTTPGWVDEGAVSQYVSARVAVDAALRGQARTAVVLHELGHVLGLAHSQDPASMMAPAPTVTAPSPVDLRGLAVLGAGPCLPRP